MSIEKTPFDANRVVFRDRTIADILDLALRFIVVHGAAYAQVAAACLLVPAGISMAASHSIGPRAAWAIAIPLALVAEAPFTILASRLVFERDVRTRDVLLAAMREVPRIAMTRLLAGTLVVLGLGCVVFPGIWLASIFLFQTEVMLLERSRVGPAIGRAQRLGAHASSEALLAAVVLGLVPIASILLADIAGRATLGEILQFRPPAPVWTAGGGALAMLGLFLQVPYLATARFFLYLNVRTRVEGWDIQTRFAALASEEAP